MSNPENQNGYFIRIRGRVLGPYSIKQLQVLRARGQFSQSNEISTDGQTWETAASLEELFAAPAKSTRQKESGSSDAVPSVKSQGEVAPWHYSLNGEQLGPATASEMREMLESGRMSARDLVWKEGMTDWNPVEEVPELSRFVKQKSGARSKKDTSWGDQ